MITIAGPLALAKHWLEETDEPFFVLNCDITSEFPFKEMLEFHKKHGKEGTIVVSNNGNKNLKWAQKTFYMLSTQ